MQSGTMYIPVDSSNAAGSACSEADTTYTSLCKNAGTSNFGGSADPTCHYSCGTGTCTGSAANQCSACNSTQHRDLSTTSCVCVEGYYDDGSSEECKACHYSCKTCTGALSSQCSTCKTDVHRTLDTTTCKCDATYYDDGSNGLCAGCPAICPTCTAPNQCLTCSNGYYLLNGVCEACDKSCKTCIGGTKDNCTSCDSDNGIVPTDSSAAQYACKCSDTTKYLDLNGACQNCHYSCKTCSGGADTNCLTCDSALHRESTPVSSKCPCTLR
eukprot:TRINITY_DN1978_c0_g1_i1.p2 TRINITY_DN1978_c0_g1~~TRINITY_DN1978_c0_g1_i1.p2  ORF type:complete len:270 (+),score=50.96 TRINITY_DN1978_c0_g1_i1:852-1661(+)